LGAPNGDLLHAIDRLNERLEALEGEVKGFRAETAKDIVASLADGSTRHGEVSLASAVVEANDMAQLLGLVDQVRDRVSPAVVVLGAEIGGKGVLVIGVSAGVAAVDAGAIVKGAAAEFGGGGGGSPQLGRGGGDAARLPQAVEAARQAVIRDLGA
jgi:alanyl-tRNA synthetase